MKTETHLPTPLKSEALSPQLVVAELASAIPLPSTILPLTKTAAGASRGF